MKGDFPMPRRYQKMQELLPKMKDMLEGGMSRREVAEKLVLISAEELLVVSCSTVPKRSLVLRVKRLMDSTITASSYRKGVQLGFWHLASSLSTDVWLVGHNDRLLYHNSKGSGEFPRGLRCYKERYARLLRDFYHVLPGTHFERVHSSCFASGIKALHRTATEQWQVASGAVGGGGKQIYAVAVSAPVQGNIKSDV